MSRQVRAQQVVALRYDEAAVAADLAHWCGGTVGAEEDPAVGASTWIAVPTHDGVRRAVLGDWVVRRDEGDFYVCDPETFAVQHEPLDAGALDS